MKLNLPKWQAPSNDGSPRTTMHPRNKVKQGAKAAKVKKPKVKRDTISPKLRLDIRERDKNLCVLCLTPGTSDDPLVIDHVHPVAKGGRTEESNLATLHRSCNAAKGARILDIMRAIGHAIKPKRNAANLVQSDRIVEQLAGLVGKKKAAGKVKGDGL
jgi:5-methylcytosine-specific restriction endonuclease McrA